MKEIRELKNMEFVVELKEIVKHTRQFAYSTINFAQVSQNWLID